MSISRLHSLNRWYDRLPEPRRFLTMLVPFTVLITLNTYAPMPVACVSVALTLLAGLYRWHYHHIS